MGGCTDVIVEASERRDQNGDDSQVRRNIEGIGETPSEQQRTGSQLVIDGPANTKRGRGYRGKPEEFKMRIKIKESECVEGDKEEWRRPSPPLPK